MRLGINLCQPHQCPCGAVVDARGLHGLSCRRSAGRQQRHSLLNDIIFRSLGWAKIQGTFGPRQVRRQASRWGNIDSVVSWKMFNLGRDGAWHLCCFTSSGDITGCCRVCFGKSGNIENDEVHGTSSNTFVRAHCHRNVWLLQPNWTGIHNWIRQKT